jgi:hypothetical protein
MTSAYILTLTEREQQRVSAGRPGTYVYVSVIVSACVCVVLIFPGSRKACAPTTGRRPARSVVPARTSSSSVAIDGGVGGGGLLATCSRSGGGAAGCYTSCDDGEFVAL